MRPLTVGKMRGLQRCATARGAISVLALDHRNNLRRALHPEAPETTTDAELIGIKQQITRIVGPASTAMLLDPEFGAAQCISTGALPGHVGLIVAVEATGYTGDPTTRTSRVLPGWSVAKARRMAADAIKLLVYYHPDAPTAGNIESLVGRVAADCARQDIALFLEPLSYPLDPAQKKLAGDERRRVVIETARKLAPLGCDVLKAEFPLDIQAELGEGAWAETCAELSAASAVPWVLLSAGVTYETYLRQVAVACQAGASGVAAGRAVWKEAPSLHGDSLSHFLHDVARERMARLTALCDALARPWTEFYAPQPAAGDWYLTYGET
jgi:tagatose-1,6-bisphosphate aldolase